MRSFLLRGLLRRAPADAELIAGDVRGAHELAVVRGALDLEHRVVDVATGAREGLLELRLVVDVARARVLDPLRERLDDRGLHRLEAVLEVDRRDRGLEHGCEDVPAARDALELVRRSVARELEQPVAEPELLRDRRAALARHDVRPDLGEPPLGGSAGSDRRPPARSRARGRCRRGTRAARTSRRGPRPTRCG